MNIMEFVNGAGLSVGWALIGIVLLIASIVVIDKAIKALDFVEEIKNGNSALALVLGCYMIAIAIIVGFGAELSIPYGILGAVLLLASMAIIDAVIKSLNFIEEIKNKNVALATSLGGYMIAIAIIFAVAIH